MAVELPSRILPHNLEAERSVLGCILLEGAEALGSVTAHLVPSDFYTEAHRAIYGAMLTLGAGGEPVSLITVQEELRRTDQLALVGGPAVLALAVEQGAVTSYLIHYAGIIREKAALRELIQAASHAIGEAFDDKRSALELLDQARERLDAITKRTAVADEAVLLPVRSLRELRRAQIPEPQFHIEGWIPTKGLTFLVGDSEAFKSWWAKYMGMAKAMGVPLLGQIGVRQGPVLYISEENGEVEDKRRADAICRGMGFAEDADPPFYVVSEASFNFDDKARYAALRAIVAKLKIEWIIVDSFVRVHRRKEVDAGEMNSLYMDRMKPLIKDGVDLLLLHHKRKLPAGLLWQLRISRPP
jgi:hypothetical protein